MNRSERSNNPDHDMNRGTGQSVPVAEEVRALDVSSAGTGLAAVRYEPRDVRYRGVVIFIAGLIALLALAALAMAGMFRLLAGGAPGRSSFSPPLPPSGLARELRELREREEEILTSYGWISREQRIVRIPVDRAMTLVIENADANTSSK